MVYQIENMQNILDARKPFLMSLLANPNLLEHEAFTELLWAVFHLAEELSHRANVDDLPAPDHQHLSLDIKRASVLLTREWLRASRSSALMWIQRSSRSSDFRRSDSFFSLRAKIPSFCSSQDV